MYTYAEGKVYMCLNNIYLFHNQDEKAPKDVVETEILSDEEKERLLAEERRLERILSRPTKVCIYVCVYILYKWHSYTEQSYGE